MFMMPMTFASVEFQAFVEELQTYLVQELQAGTQNLERINKMCVFYTSLLERMSPVFETTMTETDDKRHYKYDLRACKTAHQQLIKQEYAQETDERVARPVCGHLDGYVWGILCACDDLWRHWRYITPHEDLMMRFRDFIHRKTAQLNGTKKDMKRYIEHIEYQMQMRTLGNLTDKWTLKTLIAFTDENKVWQRNWYIQNFAFASSTAGDRQRGAIPDFFGKKRHCRRRGGNARDRTHADTAGRAGTSGRGAHILVVGHYLQYPTRDSSRGYGVEERDCAVEAGGDARQCAREDTEQGYMDAAEGNRVVYDQRNSREGDDYGTEDGKPVDIYTLQQLIENDPNCKLKLILSIMRR
jgi:hypothetical protein